jgi:hypothetical protein
VSGALSTLPVGHQVLVDELGEQPLEAIERFTRLVPQPPPDTAALAPHDGGELTMVVVVTTVWMRLAITSPVLLIVGVFVTGLRLLRFVGRGRLISHMGRIQRTL